MSDSENAGLKEFREHVKECSELNIQNEGRLSRIEAKLGMLLWMITGFLLLWGTIELLEITQLVNN